MVDNKPKYRQEALRLIQSIRSFAGSLANVDIVVCLVEGSNAPFVAALERWEVTIRTVKRFSRAYPYANKLRFFELPEIYAYDTVMFLDCDTLVMRDPSAYISGENFQAKIENHQSVPLTTFEDIFIYYNLPLPPCDYLTAISGQPTIWYCNTGVLIFPTPLLRDLYPRWKKYTQDLIAHKALLMDNAKFLEQVTLTLAYAEAPLPFAELPIAMNFPLLRKRTLRTPQSPIVQAHCDCDPVIIHYRHRVNADGSIANVANSPFVQARIHRFNYRLRNDEWLLMSDTNIMGKVRQTRTALG